MLVRIISSIVGVVILSAIMFFHDTLVLPIAVAVTVSIMLYELLRAVKLHRCLPILAVTEICGISVPLIFGILSKTDTERQTVRDYYPQVHSGIFSVDISDVYHLAIYVITMLSVFVIFITWQRKHKELRYDQIFFAIAVMILVPQSMTTLIRIEYYDSANALFLLIIGLCGAWTADTGAYFTGVAIGKHKLCPEISPKKTIEGFVGGVLTTAIVYSVAFSIHYGFTGKRAVIAFLTGAVCGVIGTVGDLSASMVKRQVGFKDYGKIMPGHGGLMDRCDSVLFVLPTFYVFIELFGVQ